MENAHVPVVGKKIIYRFPGKKGIKEATFDIPNGTTSYPFLNLVVGLNAHMRLEHGPHTPDVEEVRVTDNENGDTCRSSRKTSA